jgi:hypothetical protein
MTPPRAWFIETGRRPEKEAQDPSERSS